MRKKDRLTYTRFDAPVPFIVLEPAFQSKETSVPSRHVVVTFEPRLSDTNTLQDLSSSCEFGLVNPVGDSPMVLGNALKEAT